MRWVGSPSFPIPPDLFPTPLHKSSMGVLQALCTGCSAGLATLSNALNTPDSTCSPDPGFLSETGSSYIVQTGLEHKQFLPPPSGYWDNTKALTRLTQLTYYLSASPGLGHSTIQRRVFSASTGVQGPVGPVLAICAVTLLCGTHRYLGQRKNIQKSQE